MQGTYRIRLLPLILIAGTRQALTYFNRIRPSSGSARLAGSAVVGISERRRTAVGISEPRLLRTLIRILPPATLPLPTCRKLKTVQRHVRHATSDAYYCKGGDENQVTFAYSFENKQSLLYARIVLIQRSNHGARQSAHRTATLPARSRFHRGSPICISVR